MAGERQTIAIADGGRVCRLDYAGLMAYHGGAAVFGATVAFRALQRASCAFSDQSLWEREDLTIISAHPGPGVRDAIEFVTRCVTRGRYRLFGAVDCGHCDGGMRFEWQIGDGRRNVSLELLEGFVPQRFFDLAERKSAERASTENRRELEHLKMMLTERLWEEPLETLFQLCAETASVKGEEAHA